MKHLVNGFGLSKPFTDLLSHFSLYQARRVHLSILLRPMPVPLVTEAASLVEVTWPQGSSPRPQTPCRVCPDSKGQISLGFT